MFYGWWLIATGMVAVAIMSGIAIWSITLYVEPLENQFGWSRAAVALGPSMAALTGGVASPFIGRWTDIRGPREVIGVGVLVSLGGFLLLSTTDALWQWLFYNGLLGVGIALAYFIPFQALASRWFDRRRGMAIGLLGVGISCGGIVVVPIVQVMIDAFGWQGAFIFSGALQGAWMLPLVLFVIRDAPADVGGAGGWRASTAASRAHGAGRRLPAERDADAVVLDADVRDRPLLLWRLRLGGSRRAVLSVGGREQ